MVNRETLTPSGSDAILKRHLFSGVAKNWIKDRGDVGRAYFVRRPSRQSFGFRVAASSGPIPKAPGSAGGYLLVGFIRANPKTPRSSSSSRHESRNCGEGHADRRQLDAIVGDRNAPQKHVWRAKKRGDPARPSRWWVWRWQARFMAEGIAGLTPDKA